MIGNKKETLDVFPCKICLVVAACQSLACPLVEGYLENYYSSWESLIGDEIKVYRISVDPEIKKIMNAFNERRSDIYSRSFPLKFKNKDYIMSIHKNRFDRHQNHRISIVKGRIYF